MATQNYHSIKNAALITPATVTDLGSASQPYGNLYLQGNLNLGSTAITSTSSVVPKISALAYPGSATAADPAGGQTITINGSGFLTGISVYVNNTLIGSASVVSSSQVTFTSTAQTVGSYTLSVVNTDGGSASYVPGITYSALPVWSTAAGSLGSNNGGTTISTITLAATENSQTITYAVTSGSLPGGLSLNSNGNITGTLSTVGSTTTYNFTITATDPQNQTASRNFSYTVNKSFMAATGGTITTDGNYKVHTFNTSSTFTVTQVGDGVITYLAIAGGGAGGASYPGYNNPAGGGGAGGYLTSTATLTNQAYTITVGGGAASTSNGATGGNGSNTVISGSSFTSITAIGGGGGSRMDDGAPPYKGRDGGSGGGSLSAYAGGLGTVGQGNNGGNGGGYNTTDAGGGGGGAGGAAGLSAYSITGGPGAYSSITGTSIARAGGGAGGATSNAGNAAAGGVGGGGNGGGPGGGGYYGKPGSDNTGGGGGGAGPQSTGGAGGSGVVIIRYQFQ